MKATHTKSKSTKGWAKHAPKLITERRDLKRRCGAKAFLNAKDLKYPIVAKSGGCAVDCQGLQTALRRAKQFRHSKIANKAVKIGSKIKCHWA